MPTYTFREFKGALILNSIKYTVKLSDVRGFIHVTVRGPGVARQGLSNVHSNLTSFERKASALHFYRLARELGSTMPIGTVNYAEVFGSCWD